MRTRYRAGQKGSGQKIIQSIASTVETAAGAAAEGDMEAAAAEEDATAMDDDAPNVYFDEVTDTDEELTCRTPQS